MAQRVFWNWMDEDSTWDLSKWFSGILESGLYRGFDVDTFTNTMVLKLIHTPSGAFRTNIDRTMTPQFGVIITKQGCLIQQDDSVSITIEPSTSERIDLVVVEHEYKELQGGITPTFKVIKGTGAVAPTLTNPNIQVVLGKLYLPANCSSLSMEGVKYEKVKQPNFANSVAFIEKENGFFITDLSGSGNRIINLGDPVNAQDAATKKFVENSIASSIKIATETQRGIIEIADEGEAIQGDDDVRSMTPLKTKKVLIAKTASQAETNQDTEDSKFITPKTLAGRTATESRRGIIKIADNAGAEDSTNNVDAITPFQLHRIAGLTQKIVELGEWDMTSNDTHTLTHTYAWWNKVIGSTVMILSDSQKRYEIKFEEVSIDDTTITVAKPSADYETAYFNSLGFNRGWIIFFVKTDLVSPPSSISVNAGADSSGAFRLLQYGTPVLNSVESIYIGSSYPSALPKLRANVTDGLNNNLGFYKIYAKRKNPNGSIWDNWTSFSSSNVLEGYITDTSNVGSGMDGLYYIKVVCSLFGTDISSNTVEVNLTDNKGSAVGTLWNATGNPQSTITKVTWNLNGNVDSIGSPLSSATWSVESSPNGASCVFGDTNAPITTFFGDKFGEYILKLSASNSAGQSAEDTVKITITEIQNQNPVSVAKWSDNTDTPKTISWQTYNPYTGNWYGYYSAVMKASSSYDPDGYIAGYYWQFNYNNSGWQDVDNTASTYPNTPSISKLIQGDGNWKFRVKSKDNIGSVSNWSNELVMNITGSTSSVVPLDVFSLQILSGGAGSFHTQAQLTISPTSRVAALKAECSYQSGGATAINDFYIKLVDSAGSRIQTYVPTYGLVWDILPVLGSTINIFADFNNVLPYKFGTIKFTAYDSSNNIIGTQTLTMGHL